MWVILYICHGNIIFLQDTFLDLNSILLLIKLHIKLQQQVQLLLLSEMCACWIRAIQCYLKWSCSVLLCLVKFACMFVEAWQRFSPIVLIPPVLWPTRHISHCIFFATYDLVRFFFLLTVTVEQINSVRELCCWQTPCTLTAC